MKKLEGKIALITGGTSGIGLATAGLFGQEGAQIIVSGRTSAPAELGEGAAFIRCDVVKPTQIAAMASEIRAKFGRVDVLFVNAGVCHFRPIEEVDEAFFDEQFDTNVKGAYFTIQQILPLMPDGGAILLNASVAGRIGRPRISVYAATKAALRSIGRTIAAEVAPRRIRVNILSPGPVETPLFQKMNLSPEATENIQRRMAESTVFKRFASAEEIARAALFLASDDASYMTGSELQVDGGIL
ncbi:MAG: SDR family oxidoreductase [Bryobacterales bacterium]|nr:SDR family oxidoreductase [Bryobacterales bacterium]MBV9400971.1 SDR family oxidoreductase [Bryobacterales bacterium]